MKIWVGTRTETVLQLLIFSSKAANLGSDCNGIAVSFIFMQNFLIMEVEL